ncbi:MAG: PilZ domain-containing protein [Candidatus Competibacter sp.]
MAENETRQDWAIENDWSEEDRRQYERYSADFYLCVYKQHEEHLLGHVIDISLGGLKLLLGSEALRVGETMPLRMDTVLESGPRESVEFYARTVWSGQDENFEGYTAGLEFLDLSPQALKVMQDVINALGG